MGITHLLANGLLLFNPEHLRIWISDLFSIESHSQLILSGKKISEIIEGSVNLSFLDKRIFHVHLALPILYCTSTVWACGHALRIPKGCQNPYGSISKDKTFTFTRGSIYLVTVSLNVFNVGKARQKQSGDRNRDRSLWGVYTGQSERELKYSLESTE